MGSIADKLTYLNGTKTAIKEAIVAKGVTVTDTDTFRSYATKIGEISGGAPATKYGASIGNLLGNVDENGRYQIPTEPFTLDLSSVKSLPYQGLYYKFYRSSVSGALTIGLEGDLSGSDAMNSCFNWCAGLTSVNLSSLTTVSGSSAMNRCFQSCTGLTNVDLSSLTTISGNYAMQNCFDSCTGLMSVDLSSLITISGDNAMRSCFSLCNSLTNVNFSALTTVSGSSAMRNCFYNCTAMTTISFPALTSIVSSAFGTSSVTYAFNNCTALAEIHFRADMQATIEAMSGYANKWGAPETCTIFFDL